MSVEPQVWGPYCSTPPTKPADELAAILGIPQAAQNEAAATRLTRERIALVEAENQTLARKLEAEQRVTSVLRALILDLYERALRES